MPSSPTWDRQKCAQTLTNIPEEGGAVAPNEKHYHFHLLCNEGRSPGLGLGSLRVKWPPPHSKDRTLTKSAGSSRHLLPHLRGGWSWRYNEMWQIFNIKNRSPWRSVLSALLMQGGPWCESLEGGLRSGLPQEMPHPVRTWTSLAQSPLHSRLERQGEPAMFFADTCGRGRRALREIKLLRNSSKRWNNFTCTGGGTDWGAPASALYLLFSPEQARRCVRYSGSHGAV